MNRKEMLHAVVRHDDHGTIPDSIAIVAVVPTKDEALREVERLAGLRPDDRSTYFWLPARYFPDGRGVDSET